MPRIAGRNARMYVGITSGGTAEPVPFIRQFTIAAATDRFEVTAFGDTTKTYVAGLPDATGDWSGFYDNQTAQLYTAAQDGVARRTYMYPDIVSSPNQYWFGTAFFDFSADFAVDGAGSVSGSWAAASSFSKVG